MPRHLESARARSQYLRILIFISLVHVLPQRASAHDVALTNVSAVFASDGSYSVDVHYDANAWLVGLQPDHVTEEDLRKYLSQSDATRTAREDELRQFIQRRIKARFDDVVTPFDVTFVERADAGFPYTLESLAPKRLVQLRGRVPGGATSFVISFSKVFGNIVLFLRAGDGPVTLQRLDMGGRSEPFDCRVLNQTDESRGGGAETGSNSAAPSWSVTWQFILLGFEHILPEGVDHIVFVLGLFLLSHKWRPLMWQVTAFTVAHSITLSLAVFGVVRLSPSIVEPLIAASIVFIAVENVFTSKLHAWRPIVVFLFGLLHGMGFASVLMDLGIPDGNYVNALASFNVGVELGQLTVILLAFLVVGWWRKREWYRARIVVPASCLIAIVGLYWCVERLMPA